MNPIIQLERDTAEGVSVTKPRGFLRMCGAAKSYSSEREYKEKMRENLVTLNKKKAFKKRQNCETKSPQGGKHFMPGTNL